MRLQGYDVIGIQECGSSFRLLWAINQSTHPELSASLMKWSLGGWGGGGGVGAL